jgi:hypothetical protein
MNWSLHTGFVHGANNDHSINCHYTDQGNRYTVGDTATEMFRRVCFARNLRCSYVLTVTRFYRFEVAS